MTKLTKCPTTGCKKMGDPFCPGHLEGMPYAARLLGELAEQEAERALAKKGRWRKIDVAGPVAQEFLYHVRQRGEMILSRALLNCFKDEAVGMSYMRALSRARLVLTRTNKHGTVIVYLPSRRIRQGRRS